MFRGNERTGFDENEDLALMNISWNFEEWALDFIYNILLA